MSDNLVILNNEVKMGRLMEKLLNFDEDRYLGIQIGAVSMASEIEDLITKLLNNGATNVFFVGAGGAGILMLPAARLLQNSSTFPAFHMMPEELALEGNAHLGSHSIVVIPSRSGTTRESIAALVLCQGKGAKVITFTCESDTPLALQADYSFVNFGEDDTSAESFYLQSLLVATSIMHARGEFSHYGEMVSEMQLLPALLVKVKREFENKAEDIAVFISNSNYHLISGAGTTWPEAHYYGMCILEEMQWIRTRPVNGSNFFHGTLELIEDGVSLIILKGEDASRSIMDRVEKFALRYTRAVKVIDSAELLTPGISLATRALLSPVLLAAALERVSAHLELIRDHPLTTRRYYNIVHY